VVGIAVADLRGALQSTNAAMARALAHHAVAGEGDRNLRARLARLSGKPADELLRAAWDTLLTDDGRVVVNAHVTGRALRWRYVLTRLAAVPASNTPARLVWTAVPRDVAGPGADTRPPPVARRTLDDEDDTAASTTLPAAAERDPQLSPWAVVEEPRSP